MRTCVRASVFVGDIRRRRVGRAGKRGCLRHKVIRVTYKMPLVMDGDSKWDGWMLGMMRVLECLEPQTGNCIGWPVVRGSLTTSNNVLLCGKMLRKASGVNPSLLSPSPWLFGSLWSACNLLSVSRKSVIRSGVRPLLSMPMPASGTALSCLTHHPRKLW